MSPSQGSTTIAARRLDSSFLSTVLKMRLDAERAPQLKASVRFLHFTIYLCYDETFKLLWSAHNYCLWASLWFST